MIRWEDRANGVTVGRLGDVRIFIGYSALQRGDTARRVRIVSMAGLMVEMPARDVRDGKRKARRWLNEREARRA